MIDPITLSAAGIGGLALQEGIKFLYAQAGEVLKRWRDRKDQSSQESRGEFKTDDIAVTSVPPAVFDAPIDKLRIQFEPLAKNEAQLRGLYRDLAEYVTGVEPITANDADLLAKVQSLRLILENVFGQHITFIGEQRPTTGTAITGTVEAGTISGEAIGIDAEVPVSSDLHGSVVAKTVEKDGRAIGVKLRR